MELLAIVIAIALIAYLLCVFVDKISPPDPMGRIIQAAIVLVAALVIAKQAGVF